jgi:hypothetical protein
MYRIYNVQVLCLLGLLISGCSSQTLFASSFSSNLTGSPPSPNQAVGTVSVGGDPQSVLVANSPTGTDKVVQISRASDSQQINVLQGTLSQIKATGSYGLIATVYIPSFKIIGVPVPRRQALSVDLTATLGLQTPILHLDFTNDCSNSGVLGPRTVRINDTPGNCFGTFPYDQFFVLQVTLNVLPSSANASVQLVGAGGQASGSVSNIPIAFPNLAKQFGGVAFWIGYPWSGSFDVTDIIVTYRQS